MTSRAETSIVAETARRVLADYADPQTIVKATSDDWRAPLWRAIEAQGLALAWVPEAAGGVGGSLADGFTVLRAAGQYAAPTPIAESLIVGLVLARAGIAVPDGPLTLAPVRDRDRFAVSTAVSGSARAVPFVAQAGHVLVVDGGGDRVALVRGDAFAIAPRAIDTGGARADVALEAGVPVVLGELIGAGCYVRRLGAVTRAVQMAGALETMLAIAVRYAEERVAFGRAIAKFQAVQHGLAELAGEVAAALAASSSAADALAHEAEISEAELVLEVAAAKIRTGEAAQRGMAIAHQVLGAIGFTAEHTLQHYTRALVGWRDDFGSEAVWAEALGRRVAAEGGDALWPLLTRR